MAINLHKINPLCHGQLKGLSQRQDAQRLSPATNIWLNPLN